MGQSYSLARATSELGELGVLVVVLEQTEEIDPQLGVGGKDAEPTAVEHLPGAEFGEATTGVPDAMASMYGTPNPS